MVNVFVVEDKFGKKVLLTKESWSHINIFHPTVSRIDEIKDTLKHPTSVINSVNDVDVKCFYRYNKTKKRYLLVVVKYLNGEGFIITAHYRKRIK